MSTRNIAILITAFVVVVGGGVFMASSLGADRNTKTIVVPPSQEADLTENTGTVTGENNAEGGSRYVAYTPEVLSGATGKRVLFFYANWCPTCRPADAAFEQNKAQIPSGVTLIRVNYNDTETDANEKALANQYGITYQHTFVQINENGKEVTKWNGGDISNLLANIK